jgi:hypothetical protein
MAGYSGAAEGPTPTLAWRNRRVLAERLNWPAGALEACERLELEHSDLSFSWRAANTVKGFERPEGFYATTGSTWRDVTFHAATPEELAELLTPTTPNPTTERGDR